MKHTMKMTAWILGLILVLGMGIAAAESTLPVIPAFEGTLNVRPIQSEEDAAAYAKEIWALDYLGMDFPIAYYKAEASPEEGTWTVYAMDGEGDEAYCYGCVRFDREGNVILVENTSSGVIEVLIEAETAEEDESAETAISEENEDAEVAWREDLDRKVEYPFLAEVCPRVYQDYTLLYPIQEGNNEFLTHYYDTYTDSYDNTRVFDLNYSEYYENETYRIKIAVQTSPVVRIVFFDVYTDAEEGGNG